MGFRMKVRGRPVISSTSYVDFPATPWNYGSGHVNPTAALGPGLVYEFDSNDMVDFLCATAGANPTKIEMLTGTEITCSDPVIAVYNLNYPSIGVAHMKGEVSAIRTVTYVGRGTATFKAFTRDAPGVKVSVKPNVLRFKKPGERQSFRVHFMPSKTTNNTYIIGSLSWISGLYQVRSPIAVNVDSM
ncbi:subtilisin-like protease SBT5.3 [Papaver somniferum]|uniref:subtilisin-like protease SBT5.3 n=1 Tax=Papaver somniferum TaxID=3469 RepID=UPI000E6F5FE0|nr:subtilisin-like protease SBT5.3 [Papaver somniferum]